ncbi:hypothetical protein C2E23DRAFT_834412 [Lenzites betulinus]|nr:hypothetical protein C2E23DRAFT_834412 [Lenzites betulinus]
MLCGGSVAALGPTGRFSLPDCGGSHTVRHGACMPCRDEREDALGRSGRVAEREEPIRRGLKGKARVYGEKRALEVRYLGRSTETGIIRSGSLYSVHMRDEFSSGNEGPSIRSVAGAGTMHGTRGWDVRPQGSPRGRREGRLGPMATAEDGAGAVAAAGGWCAGGHAGAGHCQDSSTAAAWQGTSAADASRSAREGLEDGR